MAAAAHQVLESTSYRQTLVKASGLSIETVRAALDFKASVKEQVVALHELHRGLVKKLPERNYNCVKSQEDLPESRQPLNHEVEQFSNLIN